MRTLIDRPISIRRRPGHLVATLAAATLLAGCANPDAAAMAAALVAAARWPPEPRSCSPTGPRRRPGTRSTADYVQGPGRTARLAGHRRREPTFVPNLATDLPVARRRHPVDGHPAGRGDRYDGSALTDVAATYTTAIDPAAAAVTSMYDMLDRVETPDDRTVVFDLKEPYAAFPSKLLMGIAPASALLPVGPVGDTLEHRASAPGPTGGVHRAGPHRAGS